MVTIGKPDWNAIRNEYICGTISQRQLAEKYGLSVAYLVKKAHKEEWKQARDSAVKKGIEKGQQKAADVIADNATIAARIKTKLLRKLEREIDALPDLIGSESRSSVIENEYLENQKGKPVGAKPMKSKEVSKAYKLRDLTAAYKDLTSDMQMTENVANPLLQSLYELERRCHGD